MGFNTETHTKITTTTRDSVSTKEVPWVTNAKGAFQITEIFAAWTAQGRLHRGAGTETMLRKQREFKHREGRETEKGEGKTKGGQMLTLRAQSAVGKPSVWR